MERGIVTRVPLQEFMKANNSLAQKDQWIYQFTGAESYSATFRYLLDNKPLSSVFSKWRRDHRNSVAGLDIMGSGVVLDDLGLQHGLGVALTDARSEQMKRGHDRRIDVLAGDVLRRETWQHISSWLNTRPSIQPQFNKRFSLVLFRPLGGLLYLPKDPDNLYTLMQNAWDVTSAECGQMFITVPTEVHDLVRSWVDVLNKTQGITARMQTMDQILRTEQFINVENGESAFVGPAIYIEKCTSAPERLPTIDFEKRTDRGYVRYVAKR